MDIFDTTWIIVAIVLAVIGEVALGVYVAYKDKQPEFIVLISFIVVFACAFWPVFLMIGGGVLAIATPFLIGKYTAKAIKRFNERKVNDVNKIMLKKE